MENEKVKLRIGKLLAKKKWVELRKLLAKLHPSAISQLLVEFEKHDQLLIFRLLPRSLSSDVFSQLEWDEQNDLLSGLTTEETRHLLAALEPDERTELFEELPAEVTKRLFRLLSPEDLKEARQLLGYPEESVGRLMTPEYIAVQEDWTIEEALNHIKKEGKDSETINVVYAIDAESKLIDSIELRKFILADKKATVESIMDNVLVSIRAYEDREKAVSVMREYDLYVLPVVDSQGVLLGIVTFDDVLDVAEEETTEDFQKTSAVEPLTTNYSDASIWQLYRKRVVWLGALVFVSLASSGVIAAFENTLSAAISLVFFIPLLIASGGNTGTQSATLMIRAISTGDVQIAQWFKALLKELSVGVFLGATLALGSLTLGLFRGGLEIGIIVGLSMMAIILVTNLLGFFLPFVLTKFRVDPAVASGPLVTSVADVVGLTIYFTIARTVLTVV